MNTSVVACLSAALLVAIGAMRPAHTQVPSEDRQDSGRLANGTQYSLYVPAKWNGMLVLNADLPGLGGRESALYEVLHALGYATGGRARDITGWDIRAGSHDIVQLKALFADRFGKPRHTIVTGRSLGGLVARDAGEAYPDEFDGAVPACGGGAGLLGMWNHRLDVVFATKVLLGAAHDNIELAGAPDYTATGATLKRLATRALTTPQGRARLALLAAIGQISGWPTGAAEPPARDDHETRLRTIADAVAGMSNLRDGAEKPGAGVMNWNVGVDYAAMFAAADADTVAMAHALYAAANLDLDRDFALLAAAPRVQADASAVAWARSSGALTGRLRRPTLALYTAVDPRAPLSEFRAYQRTVDEAGATAQLRQAGVYRSGHCVFSPVEHITAITLVAEAIRTGKWPDTSPQALNTRADALIQQFGSAIGDAKFAAFPGTPAFPRHFAAGSVLPEGALRR